MDTTVVEVAPPANDKPSVTLTTLKRRAATRRYRARNREQLAAKNARYKREHQDEIHEYNENYYVEHRDELRRKRRARQLAKQFAKGGRRIDQMAKEYGWYRWYVVQLKAQLMATLEDQLGLAA